MCDNCVRCTHCHEGNCDKKHRAHDAIRRLRGGLISEKIAVMLATDDGMTDDEAKAYIAENLETIKDLRPQDLTEH